jgi:SAM-dependent methyltransferase
VLDTPAGDSLDTFLASGGREVSAIFDGLRTMGVDIRRGTALDFGCGAGRLTLPLASRFEHVTGVDASRTMLTRARELAAAAGISNIDFRAGRSTAIELPSGSHDFALSLITLQHLPARAQLRYIAELARVLAPGGVAVVQVVTGHAGEPRSRIRRGYRRLVPQRWRNAVRRARHPLRAQPEIYAVGQTRLLDTVAASRLELIAAVDDRAAPGWESRRLVLTAR